MKDELKRAVEALGESRGITVLIETANFLATHGDALLAAVEMAEAFDRRANEVNEESDEDGFSRVQYFADGRLFKAWGDYRAVMNGSKA